MIGQPLPIEHEVYVRRVIADVDYELATAPSSPSVLEAVPIDEDRSHDEPWRMVLFSAIQLALNNTTIVKQDAQFLSIYNPLHLNVEAPPSALDPEIQAANINFGNRGVTAALSDFTPRVSGNMLWGRDEVVQNNLFTGGLPPGSVLTTESADFQLNLEKQLAWGASVAVGHTINYNGTNIPTVLFPSVYTGDLSVQYQQPLWAGSGTEFTQIAGPITLLNPRVLSVNQGVIIARIDGEVAQIEFEVTINRLVKEVTELFWDLSFARQLLQTEEESLARLKQIWEAEQADLEVGRTSVSTEAEAADAYYAAAARVAEARALVNGTELRLRRLLGLPARDGHVIIPVDEPVVDPEVPEYVNGLSEALIRRPELRRTKWQVRALQLQVRAARSLVAPRLDFQAGYHINGFGDDLISSSDQGPEPLPRYRSFYGNLGQANQTGWDAGVVFSMPLGFPQERAQVRNMELRLAKAQAALRAQEEEIAAELLFAYQQIRRWEATVQAYAERLEAANRRLQAVEAEYEADRTSLTQLIDARLDFARAQMELDRSLAEFTKAVAELQYRQGTLLDSQQIAVEFAEPPPSGVPDQSPPPELPVPPPSPAMPEPAPPPLPEPEPRQRVGRPLLNNNKPATARLE